MQITLKFYIAIKKFPLLRHYFNPNIWFKIIVVAFLCYQKVLTWPSYTTYSCESKKVHKCFIDCIKNLKKFFISHCPFRNTIICIENFAIKFANRFKIVPAVIGKLYYRIKLVYSSFLIFYDSYYKNTIICTTQSNKKKKVDEAVFLDLIKLLILFFIILY